VEVGVARWPTRKAASADILEGTGPAQSAFTAQSAYNPNADPKPEPILNLNEQWAAPDSNNNINSLSTPPNSSMSPSPAQHRVPRVAHTN
jgi:hypothetical protein